MIHYVICIWMEPMEVERRDYGIATTAKVEIRRGPFAISSEVNGACSCSEGWRQAVSKVARS
jgi:hypothetical protein